MDRSQLKMFLKERFAKAKRDLLDSNGVISQQEAEKIGVFMEHSFCEACKEIVIQMTEQKVKGCFDVQTRKANFIASLRPLVDSVKKAIFPTPQADMKEEAFDKIAEVIADKYAVVFAEFDQETDRAIEKLVRNIEKESKESPSWFQSLLTWSKIQKK